MILLDTNALIWIELGHVRARVLTRYPGNLYASPASLLELEFLLERQRIRLRRGRTLDDFASSPVWALDDPSSSAWFERARGVTWTRDPFDRLIAAHALHRGWRVATADESILENLGTRGALAL